MSLERESNMIETYTVRDSCCFADDAQCDLTREFTVKEKTHAVILFKTILDSRFLPCRGNWSLLSNNITLMTCQYAEDYSYNIYVHDDTGYFPLVESDINYKDLKLKRIYDSDKTFDEKILFCYKKLKGNWSDDDTSLFSTILSYLKIRIFK